MVKKIYLDNAATTKVDPSVAKKVREMFLDNYGNDRHDYYQAIYDQLNMLFQDFVLPIDNNYHIDNY